MHSYIYICRYRSNMIQPSTKSYDGDDDDDDDDDADPHEKVIST